MSPEARWPTHVFGKSFLGDDGVKHSREYILCRKPLHPVECCLRSVAIRPVSTRVLLRLGGGLGDVGGGIAAPLRTLDAIAGLPASAHLGDGRARWQGRRSINFCGAYTEHGLGGR